MPSSLQKLNPKNSQYKLSEAKLAALAAATKPSMCTSSTAVPQKPKAYGTNSCTGTQLEIHFWTRKACSKELKFALSKQIFKWWE
jgi:hypothetical protein